VPFPDPPVRRVLRVAVVRRVAPAADRLVDVEPAARVRRVVGFAAADFDGAGFAAAGFAGADFAAAGRPFAAGFAAGLAVVRFAATGFVAAGFAVAREATAGFAAEAGRVDRVRAAEDAAAAGFGAPPSLSALIRDRRSATAAFASDICLRRFASTSCAFCSRFSSLASFLSAPFAAVAPADGSLPDFPTRSPPAP
jgi:hypothetical protein